ncbi:uncharacterized protein DNG_02218 [Cephalotrichum gorgonifer]|uniref:Heterokaryon incompatibility domain-containing protein n=1 Tax=Cephalotrichum gorgonifer TaxID=2041049 RepID=A0AAE8ST24_9PEZI|nr:uncharacterized protein DNG_02218 [Cephalotrichum gorgonifer]
MSVANPNEDIDPLLYRKLGANRLDDAVQEIRLISIDSIPDPANPDEIACTLRAVSLRDAADDFFALSYVWGDPHDTESILINGHRFEATRNLVEALRQVPVVKPESRRGLWVDAICINQTDIPERNAQVSIMDLIYKRARDVLCWLGPADDLSAAAMRLACRLGQDLKGARVNYEDCVIGGLDDVAYGPLISNLEGQPLMAAPALHHKPYWRRMWTLQEVVLSRHCSFISGTSLCTLDDIDTIDAFVLGIPDMANDAPRQDRSVTWSLLSGMARAEVFYSITAVSWVRKKLARSDASDSKKLLLQLLNLTADRQATDPRDKIYALAGLVPIGVDIDYFTPARQLYTAVAAYLCSSISDVAVLLQKAGLAAHSSTLGLPSWVPDWTTSYSTRGMFTAATEGQFASNRNCPPRAKQISPSMGALTVWGLRLDTIAKVGPARDEPPDSDVEHMQRLGKDIQFFLGCDARSVLRDVLPLPPDSRPYRTGCSMLDAVLRALVFGKRSYDTKNPQVVASFLECLFLDPDVGDEIDDIVEDESLTRSTAGILERVFDDARTETLDWKDIVCEAARVLQQGAFVNKIILGSGKWRHVPFVSHSGYTGYAKAGVAAGDEVYILVSSSVPVVLRRVGTRWEFLCDCIVVGMLAGEAWDESRGVQQTLEEIVLQ